MNYINDFIICNYYVVMLKLRIYLSARMPDSITKIDSKFILTSSKVNEKRPGDCTDCRLEESSVNN